MKTKEIWRVVPDVPELLASSLGRLVTVPYVANANSGQGRKQYGGSPTYGQWDGARFIHHFRGKTFKVARLVCSAFHGTQPIDKPVCMHLDENSRNNTPENLAWGTQKENLNAPGFIEYCKSRIGENNPHTKGKRRKAA